MLYHKPLLKELCHQLKKSLPSLQAAYLFGSWGTEDQTPESDLDIAILLPPNDRPLSAETQLALATRLAQCAKVNNADLVQLRRVDTVFQFQVIQTGARILAPDVPAADEFEAITLSKYQRLQKERADIIEDGIKTGRFYEP